MNSLFSVVINLERSKDRRVFMEQQLLDLQIPFHIFNATDGSKYDFSNEFDYDKSFRINNNILTNRELGCSHSHRSALEHFLKSDKKYALIMEDDIEIDQCFTQALSEELRKRMTNKTHWDYLQFDYPAVGIAGVLFWWFLFGNLVKKNRNNILFLIKSPLYISKGLVANCLSLYSGTRDVLFKKIKYGRSLLVHRDKYQTGCYLITREGAQKLIKMNTPLIYAADHLQNAARRNSDLQHEFYSPRLIRQKREHFRSEIEDEYFGKKVIAY